MPVTARRLIRKMRGGAQAHLMEASDGHSYVVKFHNNPQHRRILVNEWIASTFLHYLGISAPEVAMIQVTESFLAGDPETYIQLGRERRAVTPGWHFGSRFPGRSGAHRGLRFPSRYAARQGRESVRLPRRAGVRQMDG